MKIRYKPSVYRALKKIPQKRRDGVLNKIDSLPNFPLAGKPLRGRYKTFRSLKVWPYRVIYRIERRVIFIYSIAYRQSAYKN